MCEVTKCEVTKCESYNCESCNIEQSVNNTEQSLGEGVPFERIRRITRLSCWNFR